MKYLYSVCLLAAAFLSACVTPPSSSIAVSASRQEGSYYRKGVSAQCANWVGSIVKASGKTPPAGYSLCTNWLGWGKSVPLATIRKGDVVIYSKGSNGHHHAAIYIGDGKVIHRPTRSAPIRTMDLHYRRILSVRRG